MAVTFEGVSQRPFERPDNDFSFLVISVVTTWWRKQWSMGDYGHGCVGVGCVVKWIEATPSGQFYKVLIQIFEERSGNVPVEMLAHAHYRRIGGCVPAVSGSADVEYFVAIGNGDSPYIEPVSSPSHGHGDLQTVG